MNIIDTFKLIFKLFCLLVLNTAFAGEKPNIDKPNIIIIMADDLGYGDLGGFYGGLANTPSLDQMGREGMIFTDFHSNGPMCSPTRAALMTGRYQQRLGIETALPADWEVRGIGSKRNKSEKSMATYLRQAGYKTGVFGKWHLGKHPLANPIHHGFDEFRGLMCGSVDYFSKMDRNGSKDWWYNDKLSFQEGYATDVITDNSIRFIESNKDTPFFLYIPYSAIHFPWQTAEDENLETVLEGKDFTSNYPGPNSKLGPHEPVQIPQKVIGMIEAMDRNIGRILKSLRDQEIHKNTLIFFTSDNGGYISYNGNTWPEVGSNGTLRGQKSQLYEGGHRVPAIAWWPGHIPPNSISNQLALTFDLLPTFLDLIGIDPKKIDNDNHLDGISLLPLLLEKNTLPSRTIFWRTGQHKAVRREGWKLVINSSDNASELYNLDVDISEKENLAKQNPKKADQLYSELSQWEKEIDLE